MAVAVGDIPIPGATGAQAITGLPFQPVGVMFWHQRVHLGVHVWMFGAATGPTEEWVVHISTNTETGGYNGRFHSGFDDICIVQWSSGVTTIEAELVSFNADGFTLNWLKRNAGYEDVGYMAFGGDHIPAAKAGSFQAGATTGTTAVTGLGFKPKALVTAHIRDANWNQVQEGDATLGMGVTDGTNQYSHFVMCDQGTAVDTSQIHRLDEIACAYDGAATFRMALDSMDADGFTVDVTDAWATDFRHGYLAIDADAAAAGNSVQPDATGTQTIACPGLEPAGVFFIWPGNDAPSTTGISNALLRPGTGAITATDYQSASGVMRNEASFGVWTSDGYKAGTAGIQMAGIGLNTNTNQGVATYSSFAPGEFTLNWTTATGPADRAFGWLALPGEILSPWIPQIYRRIVNV